MRNKLVIAGLVLIAAVLAALGLRNVEEAPRHGQTGATPLEEMSWFETIDSDREVVVHCGNSMRVVMEKIADEFQRRHGIGVVFNFGGSSELLPLVELGGRGDLFICHDPYAEILEEKGLLEDYIVVGRLEPVILVEKDNPLGIGGLRDLGREGFRLATVDPRYATAGKMLQEVLDREAWGGQVRENIAIESRGHSDAALSLLTGHVDAAVVWNFLAALYSDELDEVKAGVDFPDEIRVTLCRIKTVENREEAAKFMDFAVSDFALDVFEQFGYIEPGEDE